MIDDGVDNAHSSALVKKNVKTLLKSHHLVHHAMLIPGRTLFLVTVGDDAVEHLVPVVIDGVDAQLNVQWSHIDDSHSSRVGEVLVHHLADFVVTVDMFRDITARFPYQLPPWARLLDGDAQALNAISGFASEDAQFQSAHLGAADAPFQPRIQAMLDLSDATELAAPLRQLLAGSLNLPATSEPSSWTRVEAIAVVGAAAAEMTHMGQTRCDSALAMSLVALQAGGDSETGAAAAALRPGGALRSLAAWLQASFSPGMRLAAVEAFPEPAERAATYKRRLRQPVWSESTASTDPVRLRLPPGAAARFVRIFTRIGEARTARQLAATIAVASLQGAEATHARCPLSHAAGVETPSVVAAVLAISLCSALLLRWLWRTTPTAPMQCICGKHDSRCINWVEPGGVGRLRFLCPPCAPDHGCGCLCGGCERHDYTTDKALHRERLAHLHLIGGGVGGGGGGGGLDAEGTCDHDWVDDGCRHVPPRCLAAWCTMPGCGARLLCTCRILRPPRKAALLRWCRPACATCISVLGKGSRTRGCHTSPGADTNHRPVMDNGKWACYCRPASRSSCGSGAMSARHSGA